MYHSEDAIASAAYKFICSVVFLCTVKDKNFFFFSFIFWLA